MLGILRKMEYCVQHVYPFNTTVQALPGSRLRKSNCRLCNNYNCYSFHFHNILSILDVLSIYVNNRKFVELNVYWERTYEQISQYCFKHQCLLVNAHLSIFNTKCSILTKTGRCSLQSCCVASWPKRCHFGPLLVTLFWQNKFLCKRERVLHSYLPIDYNVLQINIFKFLFIIIIVIGCPSITMIA